MPRGRNGIEIKDITLCLSSRFLRNEEYRIKVQRPYPEEYISKNEIESMISKAFTAATGPDEQIFEVFPQSFNVDDRIGVASYDVEGMKGKEIEGFFLLVIGQASSAKHKKEVADKLGLNITGTVLSTVSSSYSTLTEQEKENGVVLIDVGGGTTDVVIVKDKIIRNVSVIPFGGLSITEDIRLGACVTSSVAELLKVEYGSCVEESMDENKTLVIPGVGGSADTEVTMLFLAQIIEARMTEIFEAVAYIIEQSGYSKKVPAGVVITGGTSYLENIRELAKVILERNVRLASPMGSISEDSCEDCFDTNSSSAVGAVIASLEHSKKMNVKIDATERPDFNRDIFGEKKNEDARASAQSGQKQKKKNKNKKDEENKGGSSSLGDIFTSFFGNDKA